MNSGAAKEEEQSVWIREERDDLNLIFESMVVGVYLVSKARKLGFMNRVLREKFGDQVGAICYETFHSRRVPCPLCKLSEVLDRKTVRWEWHSRKGRQDLRPRWDASNECRRNYIETDDIPE